MSEIPAPAELVSEWRTLGEQDGEANPFRTGYRAALRKCADELELSLGIEAVRAGTGKGER